MSEEEARRIATEIALELVGNGARLAHGVYLISAALRRADREATERAIAAVARVAEPFPQGRQYFGFATAAIRRAARDGG